MPLDRTRLVVGILALLTLVAGTYLVLQHFFVPIAWAFILTVTTWPIYCFFLRLVRGNAPLASLFMVLLLALAVVLPILFLSLSLADEIRGLFTHLQRWLKGGPPELPSFIEQIPFVGPYLQDRLKTWTADPTMWQLMLQKQVASHLEAIVAAGRNILWLLIRAVIILFTCFFFYYQGESFLKQTRAVIDRLLGKDAWEVINPVGNTVKAVVFGLLVAAAAQGLLAGVGYWIVGLGTPVFFGILTGFTAFIQFGAPVVWLPLALWLLFQGALWKGIFLLLWGSLFVGYIDNLLRPLVISQVARMPFLLMFFGVWGGILAFGLIGLFLGPVILSVAFTLWQRWAAEKSGGT